MQLLTILSAAMSAAAVATAQKTVQMCAFNVLCAHIVSPQEFLSCGSSVSVVTEGDPGFVDNPDPIPDGQDWTADIYFPADQFGGVDDVDVHASFKRATNDLTVSYDYQGNTTNVDANVFQPDPADYLVTANWTLPCPNAKPQDDPNSGS